MEYKAPLGVVLGCLPQKKVLLVEVEGVYEVEVEAVKSDKKDQCRMVTTKFEHQAAVLGLKVECKIANDLRNLQERNG
jgi:hypothetical protein